MSGYSDGEAVADAIEAFENDALRVHPSTNLYRLLDALTEIDDVHDADLQDLFDAVHLDTATGQQLDEIAKGAQIRRKQGESDDKFRQRIRTEFRASTTGTTFDETVRFLSVMLDTDVKNVQLSDDDSEPQLLLVELFGEDINESVLTESEIVQYTKRVLSTCADTSVRSRGTFMLTSDATGQVDVATHGLTVDGKDVGGTLTRDLN